MAVIKVRGKELTLPDRVVAAGEVAIRAALAPSFPDAATMQFEVAGANESAARVTDRSAAVITSRSTATTKG